MTYCGPAGAGHFVKMVHNGALLQWCGSALFCATHARYRVRIHAIDRRDLRHFAKGGRHDPASGLDRCRARTG